MPAVADPFLELVPQSPDAPELIGGLGDAPAYQRDTAGNVTDVPRALPSELSTPNPFTSLIPPDAVTTASSNYGPFTDLVPVSPTSETEKALAETPVYNPLDEQISAAPTFFGELQAGRLGSAYHLAKEFVGNALEPTQKIEPGRGKGLLGTEEQIPADPNDSLPVRAAKAFINVTNRTAANLTGPGMLPLAVIGGVGGMASKALAAGFGTQIAAGAPETWRQIQEADKTEPWSQQRFEAGLDTVMQALMLAGAAKHATSNTPALADTVAMRARLAGEPPVRPASASEQRMVPTEEIPQDTQQGVQPGAAINAVGGGADVVPPATQSEGTGALAAPTDSGAVGTAPVETRQSTLASKDQAASVPAPEAATNSSTLSAADRLSSQPETTISAERALLDKLGGEQPEQPSIASRMQSAAENASTLIRDVVSESRKQGLVAPGSTGVQGALDHLSAIWKQVRDVPKFTEFRKSILQFGSRMQRSFLEAKEIQRNLKTVVPDKLAREGMFNLIEAGGDMSKLEAWRDATTDPALKRGYQAAIDLTPEQHTLAEHLSDFYADKLSEAKAQGIVAEGRENYINRIVDKRRSKGFAEASPGAPGSTGRLSRTFRHGLHRVFDSSFDAEQNGIRYQTKDVAELAPIYLNEMNKTIGTRQLVSDLAHGTAEDGRALAYPKGMMSEVTDKQGDVQARIIKPNFQQKVQDQMTGEDVSSRDYRTVDHPALTGHKWVGEVNGKPVLMQGDLALHPDIAGHVKNIVGQSAIRNWYNSEGSPLASIPKGIVRNVDKAQQLAKALLFSGSGFHHANIGFHAVEHKVNPLPAFFKSLSRDYTIDPTSPVVRDAMEHGVQLAPDQLSAQHFMEGFAGAGIEKIPIYGRIAKAISDHLFERFIPSLKLRLYDAMLERNMKRYVGEMARNEVTSEQVKYLSATQANSALSHLNYLDLGKSPTLRHIFSLTTMAPDFLERRVRFASQSAKGLLGSKAGAEQLHALVYGAGLIWGMSRILNKVVDDDWHFEEPFAVVHNGRTYGWRSIQGDLAHMFTDPRKFIYGRISPLAKLFTEQFITGTNYRGEKIGHGESLYEYLSNYVPITAKNLPGVRELFETSRNNPVSPWESFLGAIGVQVSRYSPITKVYKLADTWKTAEGMPKDKGVYPVSKYTQLRYALEDGDFDKARTEYNKLISSGEKKAKIGAGFKASVLHPFTGSQANDAKFRKSLSVDDRVMFDAAVKRRHEILQRFGRIH